jgi:hypothetical protein
MSKVDSERINAIKALFETGDKVTQPNLADLINAIAEAAQAHDHTSSGGDGTGTGDAGPVINLQSGTAADRPASPKAGDVYIETDTSKVYACYADDEWTCIVLDPVWQQIDFWGDYHSGEIEITTTAGVKTFDAGCQVTPDIPSGATIQRAVVLLKFRYVRDSSGSANAIDTTEATPAVQIEKVSGGSWTDAITIVADILTCAGEAKECGDVWVGDVDVKAQVADEAASEFRLDDIKADANNLYIGEVQFGLRVWFS